MERSAIQDSSADALLPAAPATPTTRFLELQRRCPTVQYARTLARRRSPRFAFDCGDTGAGADGGIERNWRALDAVELVARYGVGAALPSTEVELFGQRYAAPIGIAPMGAPGLVWPGADEHLAAAAQVARVPYVNSVVAGISIERAAQVAPDVFWFQLYRFGRNEHSIGLDLIRRADAAGARVLVLTLDVPVRTVRTREALAGVTYPFRLTPRMIVETLASPRYFAAYLKHGMTRFTNLVSYAREGAGINEMARFVRSEIGGAISWDDLARYRDRWKRPLVVKGILHPEDAQKAISLGVDGIVVSNHGGRQIEALPAAIDALPAVAAAAGQRATVLFDSGVRSGLDVVRAYALGAQAAFAGKAFLWGLGALGEHGPGHVIDLFEEEIRSTLAQIGARSLSDARSVVIRHPGALKFS